MPLDHTRTQYANAWPRWLCCAKVRTAIDSLSPPVSPLHGERTQQESIRLGSGQILSLVEDALSVGFDDGAAPGHFALNPRPTDVRTEILDRAWSAVRLQQRFAAKLAAGGVLMRMTVAEERVPRRAVADAARCCQVLQNVLSNAIKFTAERDGYVEMGVDYDRDAEARRTSSRVALAAWLPRLLLMRTDGRTPLLAQMLSVTVHDNGRGISEEGLGRLFIPFSQARQMMHV